MILAVAFFAVSTTAMTYNVLYEGGDDQKTLALIKTASPDIVCLQEVTPRFAQKAKKELLYPHSVVEPRAGTWGVAVLSRLPFTKKAVFAQAPHQMPAVEVEVLVDGQPLRVGCVHLFPPGAKRFNNDDLPTTMEKNAQLRQQQAEHLIKRFGTTPVLLLGDFNEDGDALAALEKAGFARSCSGSSFSSCGPTWPGATSPLPAVVTIDHILGRGLSFADARVLKNGGSDHHAVTTSFTLR